jgi:protein gp37
MAERTGIAWTSSTFNPWIGCTPVSSGCNHCYAEALMDRRRKVVQWGCGSPRKRTSAGYWKAPVKWNEWRKKAFARGERPPPRYVFCSSRHRLR